VLVSISLTDYSWPGNPDRIGRQLAVAAEAAEAAGVDTLWVADHLVQADPTLPPEHTDMLEAYTVLGFLAGRTSRVRLGALVSPVSLRAPALLVKAVTSLDVVSGGRAWLGLGAGYHSAEATDLDLPLPPTAERFELMEDTLRLASRMWAGDTTPFVGHRVRLQRPHGQPAPVGRPHPPLLIGGTGEQRTLRLVAAYADACNLFDVPDGGRTIQHKLDVLRGHCDAIGRDPATIAVTLSTRYTPGESAADLLRRASEAAGHGVEHLILLTPQPWDATAFDVLADAIPSIAELGPPHGSAASTETPATTSTSTAQTDQP
jgi:alkanesulfonate monooxygenase SsuD/methylene tetrahydromethanopterin reductase-like flavin-dependent oxidoreductase (luciferase family)